MKYFLVEAIYQVPFDQIKGSIPAHAAWLKTGFDSGRFLFSGPLDPPTGGLIAARAETEAELQALFADEPFVVAKLATYRFREFLPVLRQDFTDDWFKDAVLPPPPQ